MPKPAPASLKIVNPADGRVFASLPCDDRAAVRDKYRAARTAQTAWAGQPLAERLAVIARFRALLVRDAEELARLLTREMGKPIAQSRNELKGVLGRIDFFLAEAPGVLAAEDVHREKDASGGSLVERITQEPLGVIANISAWNYPYFVGGNVFLPALLAGNAVLYKPSEFTTLTGRAIAERLDESGLPRDVFIPLVGGGAVGAELLRQPVDGVFFTGSVATGKKIARAMASRMVKVQLELGGKDPTYVCDDVADVAQAAASLADGAFYNTGQSCCSVERIYVQEGAFESFVKAFVQAVKGFKLGDPTRERTYLGPLARAAQLEVLEAQVADAQRKGARVLTGGRRVKRKGNYFEPTVLVDVDHTMAVMRDESFGPIIGIMSVPGDEAAIALMNDTEFGLTAGVYSSDRARAEKILARVKSGSAYWNCCDRVSPRLPWSGYGNSGMGLTLSRAGIATFTRPRGWHLKERSGSM
ncbi:MAG: aldehyde dehydrogenase [Verrucomicrobia bacterium]|nr:aldehyde dehydrogenase [Verrucomicrobiota bacterium]